MARSAAVLLTLACFAPTVVAQPLVADRVFPVEPAEDAVVGTRPIFQVGYLAARARPPRMRITLEPLEGSGPTELFESRGGWLRGEDGIMLYRPHRPLAEGAYRWRPWLWDGLAWVPSAEASRVRIDGTPPGPVESLTLHFDPAARAVSLEWAPVSLDAAGRPEFVVRYHVYRYAQNPRPPRGKAHEVGTAVEPRFVDFTARAETSPLIFYRVTAEDQAGNEAGRLP